jgi:phosphoribosylglycinamide formyltransferase 2
MTPPRRTAGVAFRDRLGTPLVGDAPKVMLLGSGELGREIAIEAMRLGAEVIAVDRYANAPAMQVAHRHHVVAMTDAAALRALVVREAPDVLVPEIEQIATSELVRLEEEGWTVIPRAESTRATMDREKIRRLATEKARVRASAFAMVDSVPEAQRAVQELGVPCVFKSVMSSSGHGMTVVRDPSAVEAAYREASEHGRVRNPRVMIEEFIPFDREVTMLTLRHYSPEGRVVTTVMDPIAHVRPGTLYHESWQPELFPPDVQRALESTATAVTDALGGVGIFGVECFVKGGTVYFSEVSPRPHDTGLVTLGSQWNSEFALHARAILGLPYTGPEPTVPTAAHVILAHSSGWAPTFGGLSRALAPSGVRIYLFGKPEGYPDRRLGVAVARGKTTEEARAFAEKAAHTVEEEIHMGSPSATPPPHP